MNNLNKRFLLFLCGCIPSRLALAYIASILPSKYLPYAGYLALVPAFGFLYLYLTNKRKTGPEVFGEKIWWTNLRPIHALFYFLFAISAISKVKSSWKFLVYDVLFGLTSFFIYHYQAGNLTTNKQ